MLHCSCTPSAFYRRYAILHKAPAQLRSLQRANRHGTPMVVDYQLSEVLGRCIVSTYLKL